MNERDFTKVPNIEYPGNLPKFTCGVVLDVHEYKYYVPVSSYKMQKPDNILINIESERYNKVKGSLRFNYMFPVPDECINERIIADDLNYQKDCVPNIKSNVNEIRKNEKVEF